MRVLFIGNSYTLNIQEDLEGFLAADPSLEVQKRVAADGGKTLEWHYENRDQPVYPGEEATLTQMLQDQPWDIVVIQELSNGPTKAGNIQAFHHNAQALTRLVRSFLPQAAIRFYETWARRWDDEHHYPKFYQNPAEMQAELRRQYHKAAEDAGGRVIPVGAAWERVLEARPYDPEEIEPFTLHQDDCSHPEATGRYLSAAVMVRHLTGADIRSSSYKGELDEGTAEFLRSLAAKD